MRRLELLIEGVVQGVGFRPFLYRLATKHRLSGFALNSGADVLLEIEGEPGDVDRFREALLETSPPAAVISSLKEREIDPSGEEGFRILSSSGSSPRLTGLSPDLAPCGECLSELFDPDARRHRYPLLSCSDCGPRYTIFTDLPYDRSRTTLQSFELCSDCLSEYGSPNDRRYHAEPLACSACGPGLRLLDSEGRIVDGSPVELSRRALRDGCIVAIKGVGGYLLACDPFDREAVNRLRLFKSRPAKPLALMGRDPKTLGGIVALEDDVLQALQDPSTPIVLARSTAPGEFMDSIAPGMDRLGVMLPSTPLHHLLLEGEPDLLVMTSGNGPGEPILASFDDALERLDADLFLDHDRPVANPIDDSVVKPPVIIRRARGYVPRPVEAGFSSPCSVLALGGDLKATFALMRESWILPGRPVGDMDDRQVERVWKSELREAMRRYAFDPAAIACDMHPGYRTTEVAEEMSCGMPLIRIQHHHAHLAALMAEYSLPLEARVAGLMMDGTGYGTDGTIWGGEVLLGSYARFQRFGHLMYFPMPGGEVAAREPLRMAVALKMTAGLDPENEQLAAVAASRRLSPLTSSAGRLLDGAAHICGIAPDRMTYEAEAAMLFESAVDHRVSDAYSFDLDSGVVDIRPMIEDLCMDRAPVGVRSARFHNALADSMSALAMEAASGECDGVVLGGGCFANGALLRRVRGSIEQEGLRVYVPARLPVGDGAVSSGQAAAAAAMIIEGKTC